MYVTATEFKSGIGKYLNLAANEDIVITKNGKNIARLSGAKQAKVDIVNSLIGIIPNDGQTIEQMRTERLSRYEVTD